MASPSSKKARFTLSQTAAPSLVATWTVTSFHKRATKTLYLRYSGRYNSGPRLCGWPHRQTCARSAVPARTVNWINLFCLSISLEP